MNNKKLILVIVGVILLCLIVFFAPKLSYSRKIRYHYTRDSSGEYTSYYVNDKKIYEKFKPAEKKQVLDTLDEGKFNDTNYVQKINDLKYFDENQNAKFIKIFKSTLILFCEIGEDTEYGSKYDYESTKNKKVMPSEYKVFDYERDIKSINSHDEQYDHWFNLVTYYKKDILYDTHIVTKSIYKDINLLYFTQKNISTIHTVYNLQQAFEYIKEQCKKRYEIKLECKSKFTTKLFFNEYVKKSNKKYTTRFLANAYMHKYLSNIIFNNEILDEFRSKLYLVNLLHKTIMIRLYNKLIFVITKLHLNGFITYCKQVNIVDDESEDNFCLTRHEVKFLYMFLFEQYITDIEAKILQFNFSFSHILHGMKIQLNNE